MKKMGKGNGRMCRTAEKKKAKNSGENVKGKRFISGGLLAVSSSTCREHR